MRHVCDGVAASTAQLNPITTVDAGALTIAIAAPTAQLNPKVPNGKSPLRDETSAQRYYETNSTELMATMTSQLRTESSLLAARNVFNRVSYFHKLTLNLWLLPPIRGVSGDRFCSEVAFQLSEL